MNIKEVLHSGRVTRYHATLIDQKQKVSEHSWEVAIILINIYPKTSMGLMIHALTHDSAEIYTSDVAAPAKWASPQLKLILDGMEEEYVEKTLQIPKYVMTLEEKNALKWADVLSGVYFTTSRVKAGDQEALVIRDRWITYAGSLPYLNDKAIQTLRELQK